MYALLLCISLKPERVLRLEGVKAGAQDKKSSPSFAIKTLCDLGQVSFLPQVLFSLSVK